MNTNTQPKLVNSTRGPIRFDAAYPGSLFYIASEPSRGMKDSTNDKRLYRKAREHEGFYAVAVEDKNVAAVLMPYDLVQPVIAERKNRK